MTSSDQPLQFVTLWTSHAPRLYAYIFSLVQNFSDADDLLQETSIVLMRKFSEFEPGTSFFAWASRVAYLETMNLYRQGRLLEHLDEVVLERVHAEANRLIGIGDSQVDALSACLAKLSAKDRRLVELRYHGDRTPAEVAKSIDRSLSAVHKALARIHESLLDCIRRHLAREGRS